MKKILIPAMMFAAVFSVLLMSCQPKTIQKSRSAIDGVWTLSNVETQGISGNFKATVFNEADFNCFVGSTWRFNTNNSLGSYTFPTNVANCPNLKRNIRWSVVDNGSTMNTFQFKRLDDKLKEIDPDKGGFIFTIIQLDQTSMQLKNDVTFEGKTASFIYKFVKQ